MTRSDARISYKTSPSFSESPATMLLMYDGIIGMQHRVLYHLVAKGMRQTTSFVHARNASEFW